MASLVSMSPPRRDPTNNRNQKSGPDLRTTSLLSGGMGEGWATPTPHKAAAAEVELSNGPFVQRKPRVQV